MAFSIINSVNRLLIEYLGCQYTFGSIINLKKVSMKKCLLFMTLALKMIQ